MLDQPVVVKLPKETYDHLRDTARRSNRSVEDVLSDMVAIFLAPTPEETVKALEVMKSYSDEQLWRVVAMRLSWQEERQMYDLMAKSKQAPLPSEEEAELDTLIDQLQRLILLRSESLLLLKQRGYDMDSFLHLDE